MGLFDNLFGSSNKTTNNNYADSSSIPEEERKYYQSDEYYAIKNHEGTPFEFTVIPFEERKKTSIPSARGLYVPEILMLSFCDKFPNPKDGYPGYWWFQYGVRNVGGLLKSLEQRGFIELDPKKEKYRLTSLGKDEMEDNEYVAYTHRHSKLANFTAWEMNELLGTGDKSNWVEIFCKHTGELPPLEKTDTIINKYDPNNTQELKPRIPVDEIENLGDFDKGFDLGFKHYEKGEQLRKAGDLYAAIDEYDYARSKGYAAPALFWAYATAFRKMKDYDNEVEILEEAFSRKIVDETTDRFVDRLKKARELRDKEKTK